MNNFLTELIIIAPPLLLALTLHEVAHGYVADRLGDPTARLAGRLTLNPLKHLDPIGTIAFFLIKIGWARPVPVNAAYFRNPRQDMLWVALAGPVTNLVLAVVSAILTRAVWLLMEVVPSAQIVAAVLVPFQAMLVAGVWINLVLCIFNFLPIPPLDGSRILAGILPPALAAAYARIEPLGFIVILVLAFTGILSRIIVPIIDLAHGLLLS